MTELKTSCTIPVAVAMKVDAAPADHPAFATLSTWGRTRSSKLAALLEYACAIQPKRTPKASKKSAR